jgi:hypothetical protein
MLKDIEQLVLLDNNKPHYFYSKEITRWPDQSLKWILLDLSVDLHANETLHLTLCCKSDVESTKNSVENKGVITTEIDGEIWVDTGKVTFCLDKKSPSLLRSAKFSGSDETRNYLTSLELKDDTNNLLIPSVDCFECLDEQNKLRQSFQISGKFSDAQARHRLDYRLMVTAFYGMGTLKFELTLTNPHPAQHKRNLWDLGDNGSVQLQEAAFNILGIASSDLNRIELEDFELGQKEQFKAGTWLLYQDSSGGENWQSINHVNREGHVPISFKGYEVRVDGERKHTSDRIQPIVSLDSESIALSVSIKDFWQNFPKAVEFKDGNLSLALFPRQFADSHELQGGEQKTHTLLVDVLHQDNAIKAFLAKPRVSIPLSYLSRTAAFPWLELQSNSSGIQTLLQSSLDRENNFFQKREQTDEYGWRNYGDLFADHEILEYRSELPLVSHYNNQYDAINGLFQQYFITADPRWLSLAEDLARHVQDIDIYHTERDRPEYNKGMFWHTDHYLNAYTSTHRTFSLKQFSDEMSYRSGGGPGAEHCYSTGLMIRYFLTGQSEYKTTVLDLVEWMTVLMDGTGSVLERIYNFLRVDIKRIQKLIKGKKVQLGRYPFTRGTGNYLSTLLDAFDLTGDRSYLIKAEEVISQTVHPADPIERRNLVDVETSWSYLVFLQALLKYIYVKNSLSEIDEKLQYALASLFHYADWIEEHDRPFLNDPDILDYPNHTWTAQDLRKAFILGAASCLAPEPRAQAYATKAHFYYGYVVDALNHEPTLYFTRIQVLLLQNQLDLAKVDSLNLEKVPAPQGVHPWGVPKKVDIVSIVFDFVKDLSRLSLRLSPAREIGWIRRKLGLSD